MWDKIGSLLGGSVFEGVAKVIKAVVKDPTEAMKLEHELLKLETETRRELARLEVADRDSARKRQAETKDSTNTVLAYCYTVGYFATLFVCWRYGIPTDGHDVFVTLLGVLTAAQAAVLNYYFGASYSGDNVVHTVVKNGNGKH